MLTAEFRVNGALVGHLYIHREKFSDALAAVSQAMATTGKGPKYIYYCEYYAPQGNGVRKAEVAHYYGDGAEVLIQKALKACLKSKT